MSSPRSLREMGSGLSPTALKFPAPMDVDRLWPRGLSKAKAKIDHWARGIAPSSELRRWYGHDPDKWSQFKTRYFAELDSHSDKVAELLAYIGREPVTFLYSSEEQRLNNAFALKEYLESMD